MPDISGKIILITGATDGLGKRVVRDLAEQGATIFLHGRSPEKGKATLEELQAATRNNHLRYYNADFGSLEAVRRMTEQVLAEQTRLDGLINNAGIGANSPREPRALSADGYELHFAVNYLAPFLLTSQLLPLLERSAPSRIVNVASAGQSPIDFNNLMLEKDYDAFKAYRQSKLAQVMFTIDLAEKLKDTGVTVNSLHPASLMDTKMVLDSEYFNSPLSTIEEGARAVEYLATAPDLEQVTGEYYDGTKRARADSQAYDPAVRSRLWAQSEQMVGLKEKT